MAVAIQGATPMFIVYDVPTAVAFYRDILGFEVIRSSEPLTSDRDDYGWVLFVLTALS